MGGLVFGEYLYAQGKYSAWLKTQDRKLLVEFFGVLYRDERTDVKHGSPKWMHDRRTTFVDATTDKHSRRFARLSDGELMVAVLYWLGCHDWMVNKWPAVFEGGKGGNGDPAELVISLANGIGEEDTDKVEKASLFSVMTRLNMAAKAAEARGN
jgi:hypothetical protein